MPLFGPALRAGIALFPLFLPLVVAAVPADRSGLVSAVNNTARQACDAIGSAAYGAIAGKPGSHTFIPGLHTVALVTAGLFLAGAVANLAAIHQPHDNETSQ